MKKKLIKRAIFFMISCNMVVFTPTWASQETKNTITSSSIEVSDGSIKNIVNDDINIIDTNVRDEYGIFSNNGGKLNIDVDSLTIEHNIDRSNMFTSILSQGNTLQGSRSLIDIKTINDINIDNTAQELEQINAINAKDNANLNLLSKNGDININSNLNINRRLYDVNNSIMNVENNSALKLDAKNMNINSTITDSYGQRLFNNYGINVKNSQLNINNQENMQINSTISGRGFDNYGVYVYDNLNQGSKVDIVNNGDLIINTNDNSSRNHSYGIFVINENNTDDETSVNINSKNNVVNTKSTGIEVSGELSNVNITASAGSNVIKALGDVDSTGIEVNDNGTLYLNAKDYNIITSDYTGIHVSYADSKKSNITLNANNNIVNAVGTGILSFSNGNINLNALNGNNVFTSNYIGISLMDNSQVNLKANKGENYFKIDEGIAILSSQSNVLAQANKNVIEGIEGISSINKSEVKLQATDSNVINAKEFGIYTKEQGEANLNATNANNSVYVENGYGISGNDSAINIDSQLGNNSVEVTQGIAIEANNGSNISINANKGQNNIKANDTAISVNKNNIDKDIANISTDTAVKITGKDNIINATTAIDNIDDGNVEIIASENNSINGLVNVENKANTKIQGKVNYLKNDKDNAIESNNANVLVQGNENVIEATKGISSIDKSEVKLQATDSNVINVKNFGIYTKEDGVVNLNATNADNTVYVENGYGISGNNSAINIDSQSGNNSIEVIQGIAIEANNGSNISVNANKGQNNIKASDTAISVNKNNIDKDITTISTDTAVKIAGKDNIINATTAIDNIDGGNVEIIASENNSINGLVHAENKANTKIKGKVNYLKNDNGQSVIWADDGTIDITGTSIIQANSQQVALLANNDMNNLNQGVITASFGQNSVVKGDIIAKDNGLIKLNVSNSNDDVSGLIIEGNILAENQGNISLDIGNNSLIIGNINDYSYLADLNNQNLKQENLAGNISVDFNNKSRWNVVGQSFISKINTKENNIIDMVGYNTENKPHSLMVKEFNGDSNFVMNLNGNRQNTDMVYLNSGTGNYNVILVNAVTKNDIGQNGLRFATVGDKNKQVFKNAVAYNDGFFNIKYQIASEDYDVNNEENILYNNGDNSDLLTENRPGNDIINNIFGNNEDAVNYKLVNIEEKTLSNAGKTILNMTKANYDVAVFMGRLDKRMGDVHYLNKNDDGIWFRLRHDRIEKDLGYTVDGNMYELGYDKLFLRDDGQERLGLAFDYMKGSTSYDDIAGKGNNSRKGIWLYDTWIGDDGHYSDYILKWGHLENDFEVFDTEKLNLIKGNYDNDVFSTSVEYGYMQNLKNDWYITPQVQLQLAKVTGADYTTNQNTNVHVDGIDSIIGRAGFKLGRNFGDNKKNTFYLKADVLREFLGEQFVSVKDVTSDNEYVGFKYDHSGYWYDVGFGFNIETKKDSYAFLDVERRFGNGNKNSYQINGGFYWAL